MIRTPTTIGTNTPASRLRRSVPVLRRGAVCLVVLVGMVRPGVCLADGGACQPVNASYTSGKITMEFSVNCVNGCGSSCSPGLQCLAWANGEYCSQMNVGSASCSGSAVYCPAGNTTVGVPATGYCCCGYQNPDGTVTCVDRWMPLCFFWDVKATLQFIGDPVGYPYRFASPSVLSAGGKKITWNDFDPDNLDGISSQTNLSPPQPAHLYRTIDDGYTLDPFGAIVPYHYVTSFGYNCSEKLTATTDPRGFTTRFTYIPWTGTLLTMTNALGQQTSYMTDSLSGNPGLITDSNGTQTAFTYVTSTTGWQVSTITQLGAGPNNANLVTSFQYTAGDLTAIHLPKGNWIVYTWGTTVTPHTLLSISRSPTLTGPDLEKISYQYDAAGNRIHEEVRDAVGSLRRFTNFAYDTKNRLWKVFNPNNSSQFSQFGYEDGFNQRTSITDELGRVISFTYTTVTPPEQSVTPFLKQVQDPLSGVTQYVPDIQGNLGKVTDATSASTNYQFDDMGRLVQATSPDTGMTRYWYDPNGNLLGKVDARGVRVEYAYDPLNRLTQIQDTTSTPQVLVTYFYDGANPHGLTVTNGIGRLTGMQDQSGKTTWSYDKRGNIIVETRTIGTGSSTFPVQTFSIQYSWDANGNLASLTYPSGRVVSYQYDSLNVDRIASVLSGTTTLASSIAWEPFGDIRSMTYGNGVTETIFRDYRGQVTQIALTSGSTTLLDRYYALDPTGNILGWTETQTGGQSQTFSYDGLNRILSALGPYGTMGWSYDSVGNRLTEGTSAKPLDTYFYAGNRLTGTSDPPSKLKVPPGEVESQYRQALNAMRDVEKDSLGATFVVTMTRFLRPLGEFFSETGVNPGPYVDTVTHDPALSALITPLVEKLTSQGRFGVVNAQDQDVMKSLIQHLEQYNIIQIAGLPRDAAYSYDASGDIVSNGTGQAHYDALGRLISVTTTASGPEAPVGDYAYDGQNRRVSKKSVAEHTYFLYDLMGNLIAEWDADFTAYLREYVSLGSRPLAQFAIPTVGGMPGVFPGCTPPHCSTYSPLSQRGVRGDFWTLGLFNGYILLLPVFTILVLRSKRRSLSLVFILLGFGCILAIGLTVAPPSAAQIPGETVLFYHVDHLNAPIKVTGPDGTVVWSADFSPYMGTYQENNPGNITQPLRYPGQYHDQETNLFYNMNRYYAPSIGRYIGPDPLGVNASDTEESQSWNLYPYVMNQPTIFIDPDGLYSLNKCDSCNQDIFNNFKQSIDQGCRDLNRTITNLPLRRCIKKSCQGGTITCKDPICDANPNKGGWRSIGSLSNPLRNIVICANNVHNGGNNMYGDVAVHEWAHGCGWQHGQGGGVPGQGGTMGEFFLPFRFIYPIISGRSNEIPPGSQATPESYFDEFLPLVIFGRVHEVKTGDIFSGGPISDVTISFIDTGYDSELSKPEYRKAILVGKTKSNGTFATFYTYMWGNYFTATPQKSFELQFTKRGYDPLTLKYLEKNLQVKEEGIIVDFGIVRLTKKSLKTK